MPLGFVSALPCCARPLSACALALVLNALFAGSAPAHQPSQSFLSLEVTNAEVRGRWAVPLRDLLYERGPAAMEAAVLRPDSISAEFELKEAKVLSRLQISADEAPLEITPTAHTLGAFAEGIFAIMEFEAPISPKARELEVRYTLLFDVNPGHRGLLRLQAGDKEASAVFLPGQTAHRFKLRELSPAERFADFLRLGVWHIWTGFDHILFLLALLLPSVLRRENGAWHSSARFRPAFVNVLKIVTAFTLAHSITLSLAALDLVHLNARLVETVIALSVIFAAVNNLFAVFPHGGWLIAFTFGLVHGFGFANVLAGLGLARGNLAIPLVAFNGGVELGQLCIVAVFLPVAFALRASRLYQLGALRLGSLLITVLAGLWACERLFDTRLLPF